MRRSACTAVLAGVLIVATITPSGRNGTLAATLSGPWPHPTLGVATENADPGNGTVLGFVEFEGHSELDTKPLPAPALISGAPRVPTPLLLTEITTWLSTNFELPLSGEHPHIEFASSMKLAAIRHGGLTRRYPPSSQLNHSTPLDVGRDLVAVYHDAERTIFLPEGWTGESVAEISVLVHELVHHLQNVGAVEYECAAAREKPAYLAQERWLQQFGQDLETAFGVDMFTIVVKSACMR